MTTLPKEIEEEFEEDFDRKFYEKFRGHLPNWSDPSPDELKYWFKVYLSYIYSSARRQALTEAIEVLPDRLPNPYPYESVGIFEHGADAYRAEAIAKLTQLRDV